MSQSLCRLIVAVGVVTLGVPAIVGAQRGPGASGQPIGPRGAGARELPPADVTHIINARRELELTPRQLVQLDSIERVQLAERKQLGERMRGMRDSMMGGRADAGANRPAMARDSMRSQLEQLRPQMDQMRTRDSVTRAAAERVLNDGQRQKLREMQAERRGYLRGQRDTRMERGAEREAERGAERGRRRRGGMRDGPRPAGPPPVEMRVPHTPRPPSESN